MNLAKIFTFQYVSINTNHFKSSPNFLSSFTFQYVSINTEIYTPKWIKNIPLHSNMFLLIRMPGSPSYKKYRTLHSNMFLLIRRLEEYDRRAVHFTFQYVSINTMELLMQYVMYMPLHSNMFLLIQ